MGLGTPDYLHVMIEAQKLAFADREKYTTDPVFGKTTGLGFTDKRYGDRRRQLIDMSKASPKMQPGQSRHDSGSTTSFAVVDRSGNMVAITQTINHFMGAGVVPAGSGVMMNDEMDDFTPKPGTPNSPVAGKRPLSSMAPTIVVKDGKPFLAIGSPGATRIVSALAEIIVNTVDFGMDLPSAIAAPRFHNGNADKTDVEARISGDVLRALETRGHKFSIRKEMDLFFGGAQGIMCVPGGKLHGGGDPRRDGIAVGY
jgi:gamma-glutamyltranspeptidase/glutathione hydrolase